MDMSYHSYITLVVIIGMIGWALSISHVTYIPILAATVLGVVILYWAQHQEDLRVVPAQSVSTPVFSISVGDAQVAKLNSIVSLKGTVATQGTDSGIAYQTMP